MNTCKNCGKEYKKNNVYCSYKCRNIYVNKNLRDYSKNSIGFKKKIDKKNIEYFKKPKYCLECNKIIKYEKKENNFCNHSCSATFVNKNRTVNYTKEGLNNLKEGAKTTNKIRFGKEKKEYLLTPNKCKECDMIIEYGKRNNKFCNRNCQTIYARKHLTEYQKYYKDCKFKFSLNDFPDEFEFSLIEKHGWYKAKNHGDNLNGVSRDHMLSVKEGFEMEIDSKLISHPANCKLMKQKSNSRKHKSSSISINELKERINKWNKKHDPVI